MPTGQLRQGVAGSLSLSTAPAGQAAHRSAEPAKVPAPQRWQGVAVSSSVSARPGGHWRQEVSPVDEAAWPSLSRHSAQGCARHRHRHRPAHARHAGYVSTGQRPLATVGGHPRSAGRRSAGRTVAGSASRSARPAWQGVHSLAPGGA